jgi:hypothetical protein
MPINQLLNSKRQQYRIERSMRLFYRLRYTHHRHLATRDPSIGNLSRAISRSNLASETPAESVDGNVAVAEASGLPAIREALLSSTPACDTSRQEEHAMAKRDGPDLDDELNELIHTLGVDASNLYLNLLCDSPSSTVACDPVSSHLAIAQAVGAIRCSVLQGQPFACYGAFICELC